MNKPGSCLVALSLYALRIAAHTTTTAPVTDDVRRGVAVDQRGDRGMGHSMTGHHFHLCSDGGVIEVESNNPDDDASKEAIRRHMQKIAWMSPEGTSPFPY